jgi:hypothetical protein
MSSQLDSLCDWLQHTRLSLAIADTDWVVPLVQSVHILSIAALISASILVSLRLLGLAAREQVAAEFNLRLLKVIWQSLPILLSSGLLLIVAEPARSLKNPAFYLKMSLLFAAVVVTLVYQLPAQRKHGYWELVPARAVVPKLLGLLSLALWVGVILAGRFIAYVEAI